MGARTGVDAPVLSVFVTGHSYAEGGCSTRTAIVDMASGTELVELEQLRVWRGEELFDEEDFNFWGLAAGDMHVLADDVECPSLSPDGTRLAFKNRHVDGFGLVTWTLAVLDRRDMIRRELAETRNVDDQVEWLDNDTVMYGLDDPSSFSPQTDVWTVPADGSGEPALLVEAAWSPVLVGPSPSGPDQDTSSTRSPTRTVPGSRTLA